MILQGFSGQKYQLDTQPFSIGGEGDIYNVINAANSVAKVYHADRISQELEGKLKIMVKRPPSSSVLTQVAWPLDVIYDANNQFCGFIMPKLNISEELLVLYKYPPQKYKNVTTRHKIIIAENICAVISEVHKAGYVFGDFNPRNIGVNLNTGTVAFLDTDSYHIYDRDTNSTYRCKVCLNGYVAPELLKTCENYPKDSYANAPLPTFTKETDNFALAIHIFKLLMNGYTPYNGIKEADSISVGAPGVGNNAVKQDDYCFKPGNKPQAVAVPPLNVLPQGIADLFTRAFMDGRIDPRQRPAAIEWHSALTKYEQSLKTCSRNSTHQYKNGLTLCPWCEADERYANSISPTIAQKPFGKPVVIPPQYGTSIVTPPLMGNRLPGNPGYAGPTPVPKPQKGKGNGFVIFIFISIIVAMCVGVLLITGVFSAIALSNGSNNISGSSYKTPDYGGTVTAQSAQQTLNDQAYFNRQTQTSQASSQISSNICNNFSISDINVSMTSRNYDGSTQCREWCDGLKCSTYYCVLVPFGTVKVTNRSSYSLAYNIIADSLGSKVNYTIENSGQLLTKSLYMGKIMDSQGKCYDPPSGMVLAPAETQTVCIEPYTYDGFTKSSDPKILPSAQIGALLKIQGSDTSATCPTKGYSVNVGPTDWHDHTK